MRTIIKGILLLAVISMLYVKKETKTQTLIMEPVSIVLRR